MEQPAQEPWVPTAEMLRTVAESYMCISANAEVYLCERCFRLIVDEGDHPCSGFCGVCHAPVCPRCEEVGGVIERCSRCGVAFCYKCSPTALLPCGGAPAHERCARCADEDDGECQECEEEGA
jgi:hypothetical protein